MASLFHIKCGNITFYSSYVCLLVLLLIVTVTYMCMHVVVGDVQ